MRMCSRPFSSTAKEHHEPERGSDLQSATKPSCTRGKVLRNEYETFQICSNWQEHAVTTELVFAMREFCDMVKELQQDAELR